MTRQGMGRECGFQAFTAQDLKSQKTSLEKHRREDQKATQEEKDTLKNLTLGCVRQLGRCLAAKGKGGNLTQVACRFLSLWFDHNLEYTEALAQVFQVVFLFLLLLVFLPIVQSYSVPRTLFDLDSTSAKSLAKIRRSPTSSRSPFQACPWMQCCPSFTNWLHDWI